MDIRYHEINRLTARAGIYAGLVPPGQLNGWLALLRGYLAETGTLGEPRADPEAAQAAGVLAGRVLLAGALADAARVGWLPPEHWERYTAAHRATSSCAWLMEKLNGLRRYVREQQTARALADHERNAQPQPA